MLEEGQNVVESVDDAEWADAFDSLATLYLNRAVVPDSCEDPEEIVGELIRYAVKHFAGNGSDAD